MPDRNLEILGGQLTKLMGRVESLELQLHQHHQSLAGVLRIQKDLTDRVILIEKNWE